MALRVIRAGETELLLEEILRGERIELRVGWFDTGGKMGNTAKNLAFSEGFSSWRGERDSADTPKGVPSAERRRFAPRVNRQPRKLCRILKRFGGCGSNPHNNKDPETAKMPSRGLGAVRGICAFGGAPR